MCIRDSLYGLDGGQIDGLTNTGVFFVDGGFDVDGAMANNGRVNMQNDSADDVLTVNGNVSGRGTYALDLDLSANGGAGSSDRVVVRGGAVTGSILLQFENVDENTTASDDPKRILVFDVDGSRGDANNFTFNYEGLPSASERIVYSITRDTETGDLYMTDGINPALGALTGNIALTQSLIGSVVNRPTSPLSLIHI